MSVSQAEWRHLSELEGKELKGRVFRILQLVARDLQQLESDDPAMLSAVPRLAELIEERPELSTFKEAFSALARSSGLWNYIDKTSADGRDLLIAETVTTERLGGITFHREQILALNTLLSGKNLILSAPTSFGKSILIDALLASEKYRRVAIVLPTIALLDEFRRRLERRFQSSFEIIMYHSQKPSDGKVIFLGTQERLLNREDLGILDIAVVDEFYKLDPTRKDDRSLTLNASVYQLLRKSKQFFFLGPNIESVRFSNETRWRFEFLQTRFSTVAVDTIDLRTVKDKSKRLDEELRRTENWPALVFVSSPDKANRLAQELHENGRVKSFLSFASWLEENFGRNWQLSSLVRDGIGVHHGRIPRAIASHLVRCFNNRQLPVLLCTSTLIEGVNTAAKSVMIYDKDINRQPYDFFTFSNIRGRAGRLGQHHVGSVFLFHAPPQEERFEVQAPLFGDLDEAPNELVVHISEDDRSQALNERVRDLGFSLGLSSSQLKVASSIGLEEVAALKQHVQAAARSRAPVLWSGYPSYQQILAVNKVISKIRRAGAFGARSPEQLTYFLTSLRSSRSMKGFFMEYDRSYQGQPTGQDEIFKFLRACDYGLPQFYSVVEMFAKQIDARTDYSLFISEMPRWFRSEILKQLDEQGVPIQIAERFYVQSDTIKSLARRLLQIAEADDARLSRFERRWIIDALE